MIAKLRVLRLAREAELAPKPEETGGATAKPLCDTETWR
jgi:hypothetical protein